MMDTLSDVLRAVRLTGAVFFSVDASAPWVAETPAGREVGPYIMPGVEHVIEYHVVTEGRCWGARGRRHHRLPPRRLARHGQRPRHAWRT